MNDPKVVAAALKVTAKRARTVIDHILEYGFITNEDLKEKYGYNHPPRAIGDVRDNGIPLITYKVNDAQGRKIGAYKFGNSADIEEGKLGGRKVLPKSLKKELIDLHGPVCSISREFYEETYLQIDHRVPYRVAGEPDTENYDVNDFMLLCGAAQRQKSWACEHCNNLIKDKSLLVCKSCYYASPENYMHVALRQERRIDITFAGEEIAIYEANTKKAEELNTTIQNHIKNKIK